MDKELMLPGCYLLIILAEPICEGHKERILQRVAKGLLSWDTTKTQCDLKEIESVLQNIRQKSDFKATEILLQHSTERLALEVLLNPQIFTLKQCLKNFLLSPTGHKHLIHAGYSFTGTGSWMLEDGVFGFQDLVEALQDNSVQNFFRSYPKGLISIHIHCSPVGQWIINDFEEQNFSKFVKVELNPPDSPSGVEGAAALLDFFDETLKKSNFESKMNSTEIVGNIRFIRPTLYIFPSGQGDCSLFGITGFTMLIDGGFTPIPSFWNFIRHLERLDAVMVTRLNEDNLLGVSSLFKKKIMQTIYPEIGYIFCNIAEGKSNSDKNQINQNELLVSVIDVGQEFLGNLKQVGLNPLHCLREPFASIEPMTLYHKVGQGTLEMYILSPPRDNRILRDFLNHWNTRKESFSLVRTGSASQKGSDIAIPLSNIMSICCLLVWRPYDPNDKIARMLFPGSAPQSRIFEGLDKIEKLDILQHQNCTQTSIKSNNLSENLKSKDEKQKKFSRFRSASPVSRTKTIYEKQQSVEVEKGDSSDTSSSPKQKKIQPKLIQKKSTPRSISKEVNKKNIPIAKTEKIPKNDKTITNRSLSQSPKKRVQKEVPLKSDKNKVTKPHIESKETDSVSTKADETDEEVLKITLTMNGFDHKSELNGIESKDIVELVNEKRNSLAKEDLEVQNKFLHSEYLKDDIEPDSLESVEHEGHEEISKDSLEGSEDETAIDKNQSKIENIIDVKQEESGEKDNLLTKSEETINELDLNQTHDINKDVLKEEYVDKSQITSSSTLSPMSNISFPDSQSDALPEKLPQLEEEKQKFSEIPDEKFSIETDIEKEIQSERDEDSKPESIPTKQIENDLKSEDSPQVLDEPSLKSEDNFKDSFRSNESFAQNIDTISSDAKPEAVKSVEQQEEVQIKETEDLKDTNIPTFSTNTEKFLPESKDSRTGKETQFEKDIITQNIFSSSESKSPFEEMEKDRIEFSSSSVPVAPEIDLATSEMSTESKTHSESLEDANEESKIDASKMFDSEISEAYVFDLREESLDEFDNLVEKIEEQSVITSASLEKETDFMDSSRHKLDTEINKSQTKIEDKIHSESDLKEKNEKKEFETNLADDKTSEINANLKKSSEISAPDKVSNIFSSEVIEKAEKSKAILDDKKVVESVSEEEIVSNVFKTDYSDDEEPALESDTKLSELKASKLDLKPQNLLDTKSDADFDTNKLNAKEKIDNKFSETTVEDIISDSSSYSGFKPSEPITSNDEKIFSITTESYVSDIEPKTIDSNLLKDDKKVDDIVRSDMTSAQSDDKQIPINESQTNRLSESEIIISQEIDFDKKVDAMKSDNEKRDKSEDHLKNLFESDSTQSFSFGDKDISSKQSEKESKLMFDEKKLESKKSEIELQSHQKEVEEEDEFEKDLEKIDFNSEKSQEFDEKDSKGDIYSVSSTEKIPGFPEISQLITTSGTDKNGSEDKEKTQFGHRFDAESSIKEEKVSPEVKSELKTETEITLKPNEEKIADFSNIKPQTYAEYEELPQLYESSGTQKPEVKSSINKTEIDKQQIEDFSADTNLIQKEELKDPSIGTESEKQVIKEIKSSFRDKKEHKDSLDKFESHDKQFEDFETKSTEIQKPELKQTQKPETKSEEIKSFAIEKQEVEESLDKSGIKDQLSEPKIEFSAAQKLENENFIHKSSESKSTEKSENQSYDKLPVSQKDSQSITTVWEKSSVDKFPEDIIEKDIKTTENLDFISKLSENKESKTSEKDLTQDRDKSESNKFSTKSDPISTEFKSESVLTVAPVESSDESSDSSEEEIRNLESKEDLVFRDFSEDNFASYQSQFESDVKKLYQNSREYQLLTDEQRIDSNEDKLKTIAEKEEIKESASFSSADKQNILTIIPEDKNFGSNKTDAEKRGHFEIENNKKFSDNDNQSVDKNDEIDIFSKDFKTDKKEVVESSTACDSQKSQQSLALYDDKKFDPFRSDDEKDRDFPEMSVSMTSHSKEKAEKYLVRDDKNDIKNRSETEEQILFTLESDGKEFNKTYVLDMSEIHSSLPQSDHYKEYEESDESSEDSSDSETPLSKKIGNSTDNRQQSLDFKSSSSISEPQMSLKSELEFAINKQKVTPFSSNIKTESNPQTLTRIESKETKGSEEMSIYEALELSDKKRESDAEESSSEYKEKETQSIRKLGEETIASEPMGMKTDKNEKKFSESADDQKDETREEKVEFKDDFEVSSDKFDTKSVSDKEFMGYSGNKSEKYVVHKELPKSEPIIKPEGIELGLKQLEKFGLSGDKLDKHTMKLSSEMDCPQPSGAHSLPSTHMRGLSQVIEQPLYEDSDEEDFDTKSTHKIVEHSIQTSHLVPDYPELIVVSGGTTPSQSAPQSPYDSKSISRSDSLRKDKITTYSTIGEDSDLEKQSQLYYDRTDDKKSMDKTTHESKREETAFLQKSAETQEFIDNEEFKYENWMKDVLKETKTESSEEKYKSESSTESVGSFAMSSIDETYSKESKDNQKLEYKAESKMKITESESDVNKESAKDWKKDIFIKETQSESYDEKFRNESSTQRVVTSSESSVDETYDKESTESQKQEIVIIEATSGSDKKFNIEYWGTPLELPTPPEPLETQTKSATNKPVAKKSTNILSSTQAPPKTKQSTFKSAKKSDGIDSPSSPVYVDLAYVPHHADQHYCNSEYFQRIRARYYVFSAIFPHIEVFEALIQGKKSWDKKFPTTIIPTHESEALGFWMSMNQELLTEYQIEVAPSANRCTVNLQDHESKCSAYRVEF